MILPHTHSAVITLIVLGVVCWGLWANTFKLGHKWRYELYYFDWALGVALGALILALTAGGLGFDGFSVADDLLITGKRQWLFGFLAGFVLNIGNILLLAAVSLMGMALAFVAGLAGSLIVRTVVNYFALPGSEPVGILAGSMVLLGALVASGLAYGNLLRSRHEALAKAGQAKSTRRPSPAKAILLVVIGGLVMGCSFPLIDRAREGDNALGPYSLALLLAAGAVVSTVVLNLYLINLPVEGEPLEIFAYVRGGFREHLLGIAGGVVWCGGTVALLVASTVAAQIPAGPVWSYAHAEALIAVFCGVFLWKELARSGGAAKALTGLTAVLFATGVALISMAGR